jgi:hypothetical protein
VSSDRNTDSAALLPVGADQGNLPKQIELLRTARDHQGFHFDHYPKHETMKATGDLVSAGLLDCRESGNDTAQYTALNFKITGLGREALRSIGDV